MEKKKIIAIASGVVAIIVVIVAGLLIVNSKKTVSESDVATCINTKMSPVIKKAGDDFVNLDLTKKENLTKAQEIRTVAINAQTACTKGLGLTTTELGKIVKNPKTAELKKSIEDFKVISKDMSQKVMKKSLELMQMAQKQIKSK